MAKKQASKKAAKTREMVKKAISYRRCAFTARKSQTLQNFVDLALAKHRKPADRYEPLNAESTQLRFIGKAVTKSNCLCGYFSSFQRGASQPAVTDDPNASSLPLAGLAPPTPLKGKPPQQYVPGVLYFVIFENHVAVVQSASMKASAFEQHLGWLLKSKTDVLEVTTGLMLSDEAQKATKAKIMQSHVKAIALGQSLMTEVMTKSIDSPIAQHSATSDHASKKAVQKFQPTGNMLAFLRGYFSDEQSFEKLGLDEVFDGNLEVWIEIRYPKRKRSQPEDAMKLMDTLGIALRDIEGDQVTLKLANGNTVSGKELRISGTIETPLSITRMPAEDDLWDEMISWLRTQIKNGAVDP